MYVSKYLDQRQVTLHNEVHSVQFSFLYLDLGWTNGRGCQSQCRLQIVGGLSEMEGDGRRTVVSRALRLLL